MLKKTMVKRLEKLGVDFDPKAPVSELENILAAAEKEAKEAKPGPDAPKPEPPKPDAPKKTKDTGKITKEELSKLTCLRPGYKAVRMTREEAYGLQCWYHPKLGIGVIKG